MQENFIKTRQRNTRNKTHEKYPNMKLQTLKQRHTRAIYMRENKLNKITR